MSEETTVAIDPHVHSDGSYDGHEPVELLLEQASEIGLDGVVVTDHDVIKESLRAAELAPQYGLFGIPGVEVSTKVGHLLAIGVEERPEPRRPLAKTIERTAGRDSSPRATAIRASARATPTRFRISVGRTPNSRPTPD